MPTSQPLRTNGGHSPERIIKLGIFSRNHPIIITFPFHESEEEARQELYNNMMDADSMGALRRKLLEIYSVGGDAGGSGGGGGGGGGHTTTVVCKALPPLLNSE